MDILVVVLAVIILFVLLNLKNEFANKITMLNYRVDELLQQLKKLESGTKEKDVVKETTTAVQELPIPPVPATKPAIKEETPTVGPEVIKEEIRTEEFWAEQTSIKLQTAVLNTSATPVQPEEKKKPGFFESNPDLEKFIGENLANKIGIAILVVGIGFFVKYAIDQNWINEIGRMFIGIVCGGILLGVAHWLRKKFSAFSSVLVGGGISVLYFTIAIAFHEYHIFSQTAAFAIMVLITGFTILLSLGYNRVELAVVAILGGFGSPFMVSTGEGNYIILFSYLLILNSGMLVLAYYKKWRLVNIICYAFSVLIFSGWLTARFDGSDPSMIRGALIFATAFYFVFFAMNIVNNLKERTKFEAVEITILLSNTFLYYAAGMFILSNPTGKAFTGLFTALLAVFNFIFAFTLYKNARADRNLVFLLIGLVLTFISLAAPVQLEGNYITLFWAAETVLLLWLSQKSGISLMKVASVVVLALMVVSLVMDWSQIYRDSDITTTHLTVLLNKGYITGLAVVVSLLLTGHLLKKEVAESFAMLDPYRMSVNAAALGVLYLVNLLELQYQLEYFVGSVATRQVILGTYNVFFVLTLLLAQKRLSVTRQFSGAFLILSVLCMVAYLLLYHNFVVEARNEFLAGVAGGTGFYWHYLLVILAVAVALLSLSAFNSIPAARDYLHNAHWWFYIFFFVFVASAELDHTVLLLGYQNSESGYYLIDENHRIGYPILWGIISFALIALGLKRKMKVLRIISLALMFITLVKLFVVDLRDISEGGKIAAFISLGVLLLIVSFMYQRLKRLLLEDTQQENNDTV